MHSSVTKHALPGLKEKRYRQKREIIGYLYRMEELSKPDICRLTNMTTPTISRIVDELIEEGWVVDRGQGTSAGGKRPHVFTLNPDAAYILGVDIGRELLKIAVFNLQKEVIGEIRIFPSLLEEGKSNEENLRYVKERIDQSLRELHVERSKIRVAGVAIPGLVDCNGNAYTYFVYEDTNIRQVLEKMLKVPVFIDNVARIMTLAEHASGAAKEVRDALCVSVNECIGLGMVLNSRPYTGYQGMAGEFGHIRIAGLNHPCYCGKTGCLETVASGRAIVKIARQTVQNGVQTAIRKFADNGKITLGSVIRAARQDDLFAIDLLQKAGEKIGEGIATLIHLFNPQRLVIGGEMAESGDLLIAPIQQALHKYALARLKNQCEVRLSDLAHSTVLGTLMLVMKNLYYDTDHKFSLY